MFLVKKCVSKKRGAEKGAERGQKGGKGGRKGGKGGRKGAEETKNRRKRVLMQKYHMGSESINDIFHSVVKSVLK